MKKKLFITPRPGYLAKTIAELRKESYDVSVVGWGYPPVYVEAEENKLQAIRSIVQEIDDEAEFKPYRPDLMTAPELTPILENFDWPDMINLCTALGINNPDAIPSYAARNLRGMAAELVSDFSRTKKLSQLAEEAHKVNPDLF